MGGGAEASCSSSASVTRSAACGWTSRRSLASETRSASANQASVGSKPPAPEPAMGCCVVSPSKSCAAPFPATCRLTKASIFPAGPGSLRACPATAGARPALSAGARPNPLTGSRRSAASCREGGAHGDGRAIGAFKGAGGATAAEAAHEPSHASPAESSPSSNSRSSAGMEGTRRV